MGKRAQATASRGLRQTVSAAEAKERLLELVTKVVCLDDQFVIERDGEPVAALIAIADLKKLPPRPDSPPRDGLLALVGGLADVMTDEEIEEYVAIVNGARASDYYGRPVEIPED